MLKTFVSKGRTKDQQGFGFSYDSGVAGLENYGWQPYLNQI
jgi:hypothetical protein